MTFSLVVDPQLDLVFERMTALSPKQIWQGWTEPQTLVQWFCPRPWKISESRIELRHGGEFFTLMEGPNGENVPNPGSVLEFEIEKKLVTTNALLKDYRPNPDLHLGFSFVIYLTMEKVNTQTLYKAVVRHSNIESRMQHEKMGFQEGWGMAFSQLEQLFLK